MLEVREITKTYENHPLLRGVSFRLEPGETICLLGPSGSGKSTLLRIIAGLEAADGGAVFWDGKSLEGVPVHRRRFGLMFQDYALFPHRSVAENVAFGLRMQGVPAPEIQRMVQAGLEQVNMAGFGKRRVTDLSGGEQQRVALARALAPRPRLLMLDEPLGALDRTLKNQLLNELRGLLHATRIPAIYVTHDQEEAFALADRLILLHDGVVEQSGSPDEVYHQPASAWVAEFMGQSNLLGGQVAAADPLVVKTGVGYFYATPAGQAPLALGARVTILLSPGGARLVEPSSERATLKGEIRDQVFTGDHYRIELSVEEAGKAKGRVFFFLVDRSMEIGGSMGVELPAESVVAFTGPPQTLPEQG